MIDSDRPEFAKLIAGLAASFNREASKPLLAAYWMGLADLPYEAVNRAALQALQTCKFMPVVAELRELAGEVRISERAELAWLAFEQAVVRHGAYRSVDFDDPVINATARSLGGWQRCCGLPAEEFDKWLRRDFLTTYKALASKPPGIEAMAPLVGIHQQTNYRDGLLNGETSDPKRIGAATVRINTGLPMLPGIDRKTISAQSTRPLSISVEVAKALSVTG